VADEGDRPFGIYNVRCRERDVDVEASNLRKCGGGDGTTDVVECCWLWHWDERCFKC